MGKAAHGFEISPNAAFIRCRKIGAGLLGVMEATTHGQPSLRTAKRAFLRQNDAGQIVLFMPVDQKQDLIKSKPHIFFETDKYKGYPAVLLRIEAMSDLDLEYWIETAWAQSTV